MVDVALVGTGGMMPLPGRFLSSMLCRVNGSMLLFDCGEGTQVSLRMLGWGFKQIDIICFTHYHGDHISGLPGLLLTMANADRTEPLKLIGPPGLASVVNSLCVIARDLPFPIEFIERDAKSAHTFELNETLILKAMPVNHRMACFAYSLELLRRGKFDPARAKEQDIPLKFWGVLQKQMDANIEHEGRTFTSDMVLGQPRKGLKLVFCTDTRPVAALPSFAENADLFICEGLYGDDALLEKAAGRKHMVFSEAAILAQKANAKELWLTHYSPSLPDPHNYLHFATDIFPNTKNGRDRMTKTLKFLEE
ncbi:MAG: ribonuclease Z [Defluviitaleaceae bacterium]|nr:ribonuclease Z [Defluviitaleaceae bacterium]MCL2263015.1 ribonuclease Z [Defluviitaleaceae bacterium]